MWPIDESLLLINNPYRYVMVIWSFEPTRSYLDLSMIDISINQYLPVFSLSDELYSLVLFTWNEIVSCTVYISIITSVISTHVLYISAFLYTSNADLYFSVKVLLCLQEQCKGCVAMKMAGKLGCWDHINLPHPPTPSPALYKITNSSNQILTHGLQDRACSPPPPPPLCWHYQKLLTVNLVYTVWLTSTPKARWALGRQGEVYDLI